MLKKLSCAILSALLMQAAVIPAFAKTNAGKEAKQAAKVRERIGRLGTGADARVKLELRDGAKLEGYVSEAGAEAFAVTDGAGRTTSVAYPAVKKAQGHNLTTGTKILIGVGIGVAVTLVVIYAIYAANER